MLIGEIKNLFYKTIIDSCLTEVDFQQDVNNWPTACIVNKDKIKYAVSKWVSPKRTRSYPYERVYNTYNFQSGKRVTIIPIVKDEGEAGDRDFLSWSTIALMSLLNVYVIIAFYDDGIKRGRKITKQKFNDKFVKDQFEILETYQQTALHWNLYQLEPNNLHSLLLKVIESYERLSLEKGIIFHGNKSIKEFQSKIIEKVNVFMEFSKLKSFKAQQIEIVTIQPKESLGDGEKMGITINNYLGGLYNFTVDEVKLKKEIYEIRECKHSKSQTLPSIADIKDGLLKMILYSNIETLILKNKKIDFKPMLKLTSLNVKGSLNEMADEIEIQKFIDRNMIKKNSKLLFQLVQEAQENEFGLIIKKAND